MVQNIEYLQKISNTLKITLEHQFTFVAEESHQVLYIQEPKQRDIIMKIMKENEFELCQMDYNRPITNINSNTSFQLR